MNYRYLGRSALQVSPICLGGMMFGGETDLATTQRIISKAREQGVNFIDTADVYNGGRSEEFIGQSVADQRDEWVLATKFGYGGGSNSLSSKHIFQTVDASLKRLNTDYIDLLYFHRAIPGLTLEEGIRAVGDLIRQGKVRYFGLSNFHGWRIAEVVRLADHLGISRPVASEPVYNIVSRGAEVEQIPAASHYGLGVVPYSPLARGVLTGKYSADQTPDINSRAGRGDARILQTELRSESLVIAQKIKEYAEAKGVSSVAFSLAWVLNNKAVSSVIAGPRTEQHWDSYMEAIDYSLMTEDEAFIDDLVKPGHASTHGYTDPNYPIEGREIYHHSI